MGDRGLMFKHNHGNSRFTDPTGRGANGSWNPYFYEGICLSIYDSNIIRHINHMQNDRGSFY